MKSPLPLAFQVLAIVGLLGTSATAAPTDDVYRLGPDSEPHEGVPQGKLVGPLTLASNVYPETTRHYWVYVPSQYDVTKPASLMIFQDGHAFLNPKGDYRIPFVFDNLIYRREMPVTIGVFINPGHRADQKEASSSDWGDRTTNRAVEYNALNDTYSKLIIDELLPELAKEYKISADPNDRAIAGASSGAICAFTVAWERPDQFRKVISTIGSFTNIMGGHVYPDLVQKSEPKPIRIFLQDGLNDNRGRRGRRGGYDPNWDWHAQNRKMVEALTEKKYDVNFTWGIGTHSNKQGGAIMPDMLRWLWRDYARPDDPQDDSNRKLFVPAAIEKPAEEEKVQADAARILDGISVQYNVQYREGTVRNWTLDLATPKGRGEKPRPAIVVIHGGGWIEGDKSSFSTPRENRPPGNIFDFARLGFVVATINYRLSGEAPWPAALHDCRCAVRFLRAHAKEHGIDPEHIGAWGNSAGGHLSLMLGMAGKDAVPGDDGPWQDESSAVQAVVSDSGPIDLVHQFHHQQVHTVIEKLMGGPPQEARLADYKQASPVSYVSAKLPPLMLIYGEADSQVGVETSDQLAEALQKVGLKEVTYLRLGKVDHCPHSLIRVPWLVPAVNEFFGQTLKGENASK